MTTHRCCAKDCFNSQTTTKDVSYFGFPKSEYYAEKWAIAAGREDLKSKPLLQLTHYCLCSEHFTDDCFLDPPFNTKLKKTKKPVSAPIPTIFRNNIEKFLPKWLRPIVLQPSAIKNEISDISSRETEETTTVLVIPETLAQLAQQKTEETKEKASITDQFQSLNEEGIEEWIEEDSDYLTESDKSSNKEMCRLCAHTFNCADMIFIFDNNITVKILNTILPGEIEEDDDLSHLICSECLQKASKCFEVIKDFRTAQQLQRNIIVDCHERTQLS